MKNLGVIFFVEVKEEKRLRFVGRVINLLLLFEAMVFVLQKMETPKLSVQG